MIIQENQISCTQTSIFIQKILPKCYAFINALLKKNKNLNFMHSNMYFHSNQKFKFHQKLHAFIKHHSKNNRKSNFMHSSRQARIQSKISSNKIFVHSYMHFSKRNKSKVYIQTNFMHCNTQFSKFILNQNLHAYINAFSRKNR